MDPAGASPRSPHAAAGAEALYAELVRIARAELARHQRRGTLDTRSLVHETWIRLCHDDPAFFADRKHFYATAAKAMRHVVIDHARARQAARRGAGAVVLSIDAITQQPMAIDMQAEQLVQMDAALDRLAEADPRLVQIVELRFFSGLEVKEIAALLGVSEPTIKRGTRVAKAFLEKEIGPG
jgi:RNA polymerase sigma factor (TIGR02999 family)